MVETIAETRLKTEAKHLAELAVNEYRYVGHFLKPKFKALRPMSEKAFEDHRAKYGARNVYVVQFWIPNPNYPSEMTPNRWFTPQNVARYRVVAVHPDSGPPPPREKGDG